MHTSQLWVLQAATWKNLEIPIHWVDGKYASEIGIEFNDSYSVLLDFSLIQHVLTSVEETRIAEIFEEAWIYMCILYM